MQGLYAGGSANNGASAGLFCFYADNGTTNANANISSQLQSVDFLIITSA